MPQKTKTRPSSVVGPLGSLLTLDSLPPDTTTRWVMRRKAEVVAAVIGGLLSFDEACKRYSLSPEELASWHRTLEHFGMLGLRATQVKRYREKFRKADGTIPSGEFGAQKIEAPSLG